MAIWQVRLNFVIRECAGKECMDWGRLDELRQCLDVLFEGAGQDEFDGVIHWGNYETDDARLRLDDDELHLVIRIDLRKPYDAFVIRLVDTLAKFDLGLESDDSIVELNEENVTRGIHHSRAFLYVTNWPAWVKTLPT